MQTLGTPALAYGIGKAGQVVVTTIAQLAVLLGVAAIAYDVPLPGEAGRWATFAWVVLLGILAGTVLGLAAATFIGSARSAGAGIPASAVVLQFLSGVFFIDSDPPGWTATCLKDTPLPRLADAVREAARGKTVLAPRVAARLVSRVRAPAADAPTTRELEVLAEVARGLTNAEIGRQLFIGEATVKTHLLRVFAKLGVDDRTRAVLVAVERGLLPGPGG